MCSDKSAKELPRSVGMQETVILFKPLIPLFNSTPVGDLVAQDCP